MFATVLVRFRMGTRLTPVERQQLLEGLVTLGKKFIEDFVRDDQLGPTRLEVSARRDLRVPDVPFDADEEAVPGLLQDARVRAPVSIVSEGIRARTGDDRTLSEQGHTVTVARESSQPRQRTTRKTKGVVRGGQT